jgi:type IV secretion system protein VirB6
LNAWRFFAYLYTHADTPILAWLVAAETRLSDALAAPLMLVVTLYIAGMTAVELFKPGGDPLMGLFRKMIRASVVISAVGMATYTPLVHNILLNDLPNSLTNAVSGATGNTALGPAAFDTLLNQSFATGLMVYKSLSGWSAKSFGLSVTVGLFLLASGFCIGVAFCIFLAAHVLLALTLAFGPFFMCALLWGKTVHWFDGWLSVALTLVMCEALLVGLLSLLINVETDLIHEITNLNGSPGINMSDEFAQLHLLIEGFILFASIGFFASVLPFLAARMMGGAAMEFAPITNAFHGAMGGAAGAAGRTLAGPAPQQAPGQGLGHGSAGMRQTAPVGRAP